MRRLALAAALLSAPLLAAPAPPPPQVLVQADVPQDHGPQAVTQLIRTFPVGGSSGWHTHPGIELGYVLSGVTEMRLADGTRHHYAAGESFSIPRGAVHNGVNVGRVPVRLLVTYVLDKGAPQRTDAPDPGAH